MFRRLKCFSQLNSPKSRCRSPWGSPYIPTRFRAHRRCFTDPGHTESHCRVSTRLTVRIYGCKTLTAPSAFSEL